MDNPLHHFELHRIVPIDLFGLDLSINQAVIMMWLVVAGISLIFILGGRQRRLVPSKFQSVVEVTVLFLRQTILETVGPKGLVFLPFLVTLFFFILFSNLLGLIPGAYTATSQVMVTGVFAVAVYVMSLVVGFWYHGPGFLKILAPSGVPGWLLPLMVPIELVSQLARPVTLAVRLFANMTAGHMVILIFLGLMFMGGLWVGWLPFAMTVALYLLEVFVAFMQAYVFVVLTCVYMGEAIHPH
jgi:F-type H+-transporting ATPase subunit a